MSPLQDFWTRQGSTRLVSLMRILTVCVVWSRFAAGMVPAFQDRPVDWALCLVFWIASPLALVGLWSRVTIGLTGGVCMGAYYAQGIFGGVAPMSSHHVYALALLACLLALTPCGGSFSVDRWRSGAPERGPVWGQTLLAIQVTVLYLGAVYEKSYLGWLDGSRLAQIGQYIYLGSDQPGPVYDALAAASAIGTWAIELWLALGIWFSRWRVQTFLLGFVFHGLVYIGTPVATFTTTMYVFLLVALEPDRVHGWFELAVPLPPAARPVALLLAPLLALPVVRSLGVWMPVPATAAFEELALDACEVEFHASGVGLVAPDAARMNGPEGVERAAGKLCRVHGPVDVVGRCATSEGWAAFDRIAWCPSPVRVPSTPRRRSAR